MGSYKHIAILGFLEKIFITPMNHGIHHAKNKEYIDANYGGVFIIWDRMFGTYIAEKPDVKPVYGTVTPKKLESDTGKFSSLLWNAERLY